MSGGPYTGLESVGRVETSKLERKEKRVKEVPDSP